MDNPFVKVSPTTKVYEVLDQKEGLVRLKVVTTVKDVPYSDYFACEEFMDIVQPNLKVKSIVVRS